MQIAYVKLVRHFLTVRMDSQNQIFSNCEGLPNFYINIVNICRRVLDTDRYILLKSSPFARARETVSIVTCGFVSPSRSIVELCTVG
jgi:hypothetical protein